MDKNTIIGLLLITAIIIGFSILNRPSPEQLEAQSRTRDSIQLVEQQRAILAEERNAVDTGTTEFEQGSNVSDFFGAGQPLQASAGDTTTFVETVVSDSPGAPLPATASEETVILEN